MAWVTGEVGSGAERRALEMSTNPLGLLPWRPERHQPFRSGPWLEDGSSPQDRSFIKLWNRLNFSLGNSTFPSEPR